MGPISVPHGATHDRLYRAAYVRLMLPRDEALFFRIMADFLGVTVCTDAGRLDRRID